MLIAMSMLMLGGTVQGKVNVNVHSNVTENVNMSSDFDISVFLGSMVMVTVMVLQM